MTTPIVQSITDELIENLGSRVSIGIGRHITAEEMAALLQRLRDAEADAARWQLRAEVLRQLYNSMITNAELDAVIDAAVRLKS